MVRNPLAWWREVAAEEARITERAAQRIAWDRFAAGHQDPEAEAQAELEAEP